MRIGIDIRCLLDVPLSGVGVYTQTLLHALLQHDQTTTYVLFVSGITNARHAELRQAFTQYPNVEFFHLTIANKIINSLWWIGLGTRLDVLLDVDSIWMPQFNFVRMSKKATVHVTCHDISFYLFPHLYSKKGRLWHWFINPKRLYYNAHCIIAVSEQTKNDLIAFGISKKRIKVIEPLVAYSTSATNTDLKAISEKYFLYIGTFDPRKNILALREAYDIYLQQGGTAHLVLCGRLGWHKSKYYQSLLRWIQATPSVKYIGYVTDAEKFSLYQGAIATYFVSLYEGFGFPVLEAMSNNCPVIISNTASLPEVAQGAALMVDPYDLGQICQAMTLLENDAVVSNTLRKAGLLVSEQWSSSSQKRLQKLHALLQS